MTVRDEAGRTRRREGLNEWSARQIQATAGGDTDTAVRLARSIACLAPDDPVVLSTSQRVQATGHLDTCASFARMVYFLDPSSDTCAGDRLHWPAKANRPDLMPPHWMRDVLLEAVTLQRLLQQSGAEAACEYLRRPDLIGNRFYMPRFRALRHFARFNADPAYRASFVRDCILVTNLTPADRADPAPEVNQVILDNFVEIADLTEKTDTVVATGELDAYPTNVEKRIRANRIATGTFTPVLNAWKTFVSNSFRAYWRHLTAAGHVQDLYGFAADRASNCQVSTRYHMNEILAGPVIGPHYHSGHRFDHMIFPLLSAVYYPRTIAENDTTKAGYLEFGRPEFTLPFEPACLSFRPVAGSLIVFPAFAYHGVIPIDRAPRYSINIDAYLKPREAASWEVSELFA